MPDSVARDTCARLGGDEAEGDPILRDFRGDFSHPEISELFAALEGKRTISRARRAKRRETPLSSLLPGFQRLGKRRPIVVSRSPRIINPPKDALHVEGVL